MPRSGLKSIAAFQDELERCEALAIPWLVTHPGVATFSNLVLTIAGTYKIKATDSQYGLSIPSATFKVT